MRQRLLKLEIADRPSPMRRDGQLREAPDLTEIEARIEAAATLLAEIADAFGVEMDGEEPAANAHPVRPPPPAAPKPPSVPPPTKAARRRASPSTVAPTPAPVRSSLGTRIVAPPPQPATRPINRRPPADPEPPIELRPAGPVSSAAFWSLMDRWAVPDLLALDLIGHAGDLTKKGTRPRFKLIGSEIDVLVRLRQINDALTALGIEPAHWLTRPLADAPFRGATPLAFLARRRQAGLGQIMQFILQLGLRRSLAQA